MAREEMVTDQFLTGLDSHELRVQAATNCATTIENLICIVLSLEAMGGEEKGGRARGGPTQTRFAEEEGYESDTTWIVEQVLAKLGPEL